MSINDNDMPTVEEMEKHLVFLKAQTARLQRQVNFLRYLMVIIFTVIPLLDMVWWHWINLPFHWLAGFNVGMVAGYCYNKRWSEPMLDHKDHLLEYKDNRIAFLEHALRTSRPHDDRWRSTAMNRCCMMTFVMKGIKDDFTPGTEGQIVACDSCCTEFRLEQGVWCKIQSKQTLTKQEYLVYFKEHLKRHCGVTGVINGDTFSVTQHGMLHRGTPLPCPNHPDCPAPNCKGWVMTQEPPQFVN